MTSVSATIGSIVEPEGLDPRHRSWRAEGVRREADGDDIKLALQLVDQQLATDRLMRSQAERGPSYTSRSHSSSVHPHVLPDRAAAHQRCYWKASGSSMSPAGYGAVEGDGLSRTSVVRCDSLRVMFNRRLVQFIRAYGLRNSRT